MANPRRFLILDPDPAVCVQAADIAEGLGFEVVHTGEPRIFRDYCLMFYPDVVALNLGPSPSQTDGVEMLRFLAGIESRASVLIFTGQNPRVREAALRLGREQGLRMLGGLVKPLELEALEQHLLGFQQGDVSVS